MSNLVHTRPEPVLPIEQYRTEQQFDIHGGTPILDLRHKFPAHQATTTILRVRFSDLQVVDGISVAPAKMQGLEYATSNEAKAQMLVQYDPASHLLLGFWPGTKRSDVFILTHVDHYLRQLGYVREADLEMTDSEGNKWVKVS